MSHFTKSSGFYREVGFKNFLVNYLVVAVNLAKGFLKVVSPFIKKGQQVSVILIAQAKFL